MASRELEIVVSSRLPVVDIVKMVQFAESGVAKFARVLSVKD